MARDDLLQARLAEMRAENSSTSELEAWLDLSRLNIRPKPPKTHDDDDVPSHGVPRAHWEIDRRDGWIVPIPVGYAPLTDLQRPGSVTGSRDVETPFRFVETLWSIGQWISPHRLQRFDEMWWYPSHLSDGTYRCINSYVRNNSESPCVEEAGSQSNNELEW